MFIDDTMGGCGCAGEVKLNERIATRVSLFDVHFSEKAMILIGLGIKGIAVKHGLPEAIVKHHMKGNLYYVPPSDNIYFLFHLPEIDADMHISIPPCHWDFCGQAKEKYT